MDDVIEVSPKVDKKRGWALTLLLSFWLLGGLMGMFMYFAVSKEFAEKSLMVPLWGARALGVGSMMMVICLGAIWNFKRWGIYGLYITLFAAMILNVVLLGLSIRSIGGPLIAVALIYFLTKPKMQMFE